MTAAVEHVLAQALELSEDERIDLAYRLLGVDLDEPPGWWEQLEPEIDEIDLAIRSGTMGTAPASEVQRRVRERIARHGA